jgi:hypothetical protein
MRRCSWRSALFRSASEMHDLVHATTTAAGGRPQQAMAMAVRVHLPGRVWARAAKIQARGGAQHAPVQCQTPKLSLAFAADLVQGLGVTLVAEIDRGGMSRVYATSADALVVKISDVARGWSRHEPRAYGMLEGAGLPAARVAFARFRQGFMIIGLEKLQCSFAAVLKTCAMEDALVVDELVRSLKQLLAHLKAAAITFGDLSATNIMYRVPPGELCLIDPQFACPTAFLTRGLGRDQAGAFDTVHLALKIHAIGLADPSPAVRRTAAVVCCALLNADRPPSQEQTAHWLRRDAPVGLRLAYDAMARAKKSWVNGNAPPPAEARAAGQGSEPGRSLA